MIYGLLVILVAAALGLLVVSRKPDNFRTERSVLIAAPADRIFPLIDDFRAWPAWSPWEKKDPDMQRSLSGAETGVGAVYAWDGDRNIGAGRMEILESLPCRRLAIRLDFFRPFTATNTAEFTMAPDGEGTRVTWAMFGPQRFVGKLMSVVIDCDRMVGKEFEAGLANLKAQVEEGGEPGLAPGRTAAA